MPLPCPGCSCWFLPTWPEGLVCRPYSLHLGGPAAVRKPRLALQAEGETALSPRDTGPRSPEGHMAIDEGLSVDGSTSPPQFGYMSFRWCLEVPGQEGWSGRVVQRLCTFMLVSGHGVTAREV